MQQTMTIELKELLIFGYHGLYPEEKVLGNEFLVDLKVSFPTEQGTITDISGTVNYATLYEIVKEKMSLPRDLLETVAMDIAHRVKEKFPFIVSAIVSIEKKFPPFKSFQGKVGVKFEYGKTEPPAG